MAATALPSDRPAILRKALAISAIVVALIFAVTAWALWPRPAPPPVLGQLPSFTLTDQQGQPFGTRALAGKLWVADFVFTRCPSACPLLTQHMSEVQRRARGLPLQFVSISVDPTYDTPEVLRGYIEKRHLDGSNWHFLTGSTNDAIQKVVTDGFKEVLERDGKPGPQDFMSIVHGGHFVLVDGQGQIRGYYDANTPQELDTLLRDARALAD